MRRSFSARSSSLLGASLGRRLSTTFYDSQSGKHVSVPTGVQCHVGISAVAIDRLGAALQHLIKQGKPIKGIASVLHPVVVPSSTVEQQVAAIVEAGTHDWLCVAISAPSEVDAGISAVQAALGQGLRARVLLAPEVCESPYDVQLHTANLGDAGAEAILLSVSHDLDQDELREMVDMACEVDLLGVPMRSRLGLRIKAAKGDAASALKLAQFAHSQLELLHFHGCLAGKESVRPSDLLPALGKKKPDYNFGSLVLAEHVPDAA